MRAMEDARRSVEATKPNTFIDRMMESFMKRIGMGSRALPEQPTFLGLKQKTLRSLVVAACVCRASPVESWFQLAPKL